MSEQENTTSNPSYLGGEKEETLDAQRGSNFLAILFLQDQYPMDGDDLEEAIRIASVKSPSSAFDAAQRYYVMKHGSAVLNGYLGFAKSTRWLAMIRRDEGQMTFDRKVNELRHVCR